MIRLKSRQGSTSILIILGFLMLIIFSVLAISSSSADYRLAQRNANWTSDYYQLEGRVSEYRYNLDRLLYNENVTNIDQINQITSVAQGHSHPVINGVVQEVAGHTHIITL